jgi:hypothetical protein
MSPSLGNAGPSRIKNYQQIATSPVKPTTSIELVAPKLSGKLEVADLIEGAYLLSENEWAEVNNY